MRINGLFLCRGALVMLLPALPLCAGVTNITHPAYFSTVHDAVSAAVHGDTLLVSTGRYASDWISISDKNLRILGGYRLDFSSQLGAAASSVLDGGSYVASVSKSTSVFNRLALTGARGHGLQANSSALVTCQYSSVSGNTNGSYGAGIRVISSARVVLENSTVENNATTNAADGDGAGIYVSSGSLVIGDGCSVQNNSSVTRGGGLYVNIGAVDIFGATAINGNYAPQGGGIYARNDALVKIHDNADVRGNVAGIDGGGVYVSNATLLAYDSNTYVGYPYATTGRNSATNDGGNVYAMHATVIISNGAAVANGLALADGGGVFLTNSTLLLTGGGHLGTFNGNYPKNEARHNGGGACLYGSTLNAGAGSDLVFGRASNGGGIWAQDARLDLAGARVLSNQCVLLGGGMYMYNATFANFTNVLMAGNDATGALSRGGALYATGNTNALQVTLLACTLTNNSTTSVGGAIRWYTTGALTARNCIITHNRAGQDGGALAMDGYPGLLYLNNCLVRHNRADDNGGACAIARGVLIVDETDLFSNQADADSSGAGDGGAVYVSGLARVICRGGSSPNIYANQAVNGGGLAVYNGATATVERTGAYGHEIYHNSATGNGGGICANNANVLLGQRISLYENDAQYGGGMFATNHAVVECHGTNTMPVGIFRNSAQYSGGGLYAVGSGTVIRLHTTVFGVNSYGVIWPNIARGGSGHGGGGAAIVTDARLEARNCQFLNNVSSNSGGGLFVSGASADVRSAFPATPVTQPLTRFWNNAARYGAAVYVGGGTLAVFDADFVSNRATIAVGGIECVLARADVVNGVFVHNTASNGVAVAAALGSAVALLQCTIAQNSTNAVSTELGGMCVLTNCIVWDNPGVPVTAGNHVSFSDIQGGYAGAGNLNVNPLFAAPVTLDFQLTLGSPCIDTGTPAGVSHDILGVPRPFGGAPDLGAYEFVPEPSALALLAVLLAACHRKNTSVL